MSTGSRHESDGAGVEPGQVEQVAGELGQPAHLLAGRLHELGAGLGVEVLLCQQLEEPAEREERRAQLVRGVGDEVLAGAVDLGQPGLHEVERARQPGRARRGTRRRWAGRTCRRRCGSPPPSGARAGREIARAAPHPTTTATASATSVAIRIWRSTSEAAELTSLSPDVRKSRPPDTVNATTTPPLGVRPRATPERSGRLGNAGPAAGGAAVRSSSGSSSPSTRRYPVTVAFASRCVSHERAAQVLSGRHRALEAGRLLLELRDAFQPVEPVVHEIVAQARDDVQEEHAHRRGDDRAEHQDQPEPQRAKGRHADA